jgi:hypothetical protein
VAEEPRERWGSPRPGDRPRHRAVLPGIREAVQDERRLTIGITTLQRVKGAV